MQNSVGTILGQIGSGKSTLIKEIILEPHRKRVIVIDALAEYGAASGCKVIYGFEDSLAALERIRPEDDFKLSLRCLEPSDNLDLLGVCFEHPRTLLVMEEASLYCSPASLPLEVAQLIRYGRHRELDLIFVTRRPSELHRDATAQSHWIATFQQSEPRDLLYIRARMGTEAAERAATLPPFHIVLATRLWDRVPHPVLRRAIASDAALEAHPDAAAELEDEAPAELEPGESEPAAENPA